MWWKLQFSIVNLKYITLIIIFRNIHTRHYIHVILKITNNNNEHDNNTNNLHNNINISSILYRFASLIDAIIRVVCWWVGRWRFQFSLEHEQLAIQFFTFGNYFCNSGIKIEMTSFGQPLSKPYWEPLLSFGHRGEKGRAHQILMNPSVSRCYAAKLPWG